MTDRTAASAGFVLAGVALAATLRGWLRLDLAVPPGTGLLVGIAFAALAAVAFGLRHYGRLDPKLGAALAGLAALGIVAGGAIVTLRSGLPPWAAIATVGGAGAAIAAYADWRGMDRGALLERMRVAALGGLLGAAGILMLVVWSVVIEVFLLLLTPDGGSTQVRTALSTFALGAGTLTVAAAYLRWSERDWSFVDLRWPSLRHLGYVAAGIGGVLGANIAIGLLFQELRVESATHSVVETAQTTGQPSMLLVLIPLSYLVIGPGEELLYRNVIQKALRESFSPVAGVVVASAIFAAVHFPAYWNPDAGPLATVNTLVIIFAMALVLGGVYERTRNVVVPILVHGTFNALAFAATYAELTGMAG